MARSPRGRIRQLATTSDDPLTQAIAPPPDESEVARAERLRQEAEAKRISDDIDEELKRERAVWKKNKSLFKLLLLGQSESGKSTTLKNFQLAFAPNAWQQERASWRSVIQLNLVRSVNIILDVLAEEMAAAPSRTTSPGPGSIVTSRPTSPNFHTIPASPSADLDPDADADADTAPPLEFSHQHALLKMRLTPLRQAAGNAGSVEGSTSEHGERGRMDSATEVLAGCAGDVRELWANGVVRTMLARRKMHLEESSGFFLDDVERIATRTYEPTDDDVVRARFRTLGVQEYSLTFENTDVTERGIAKEWMIYDVGGARTSRAAWLPYFEDAHAILFLAPISCFDEVLTEDRRVNRLEDSFILWKAIVSSKLLTKCIIILFLNKYDLLARKLKSGVKVKKYLSSFGDRENSAAVLAKYLHQKFRDQHKDLSPEPRSFYGYVTSVVDTKATASTLLSVRDGLLQQYLAKADLV
ncbi:hypothetical protein POSPLADRAFT_1169191 [Postia placenta MAD-698-R-SB12]|uniref:G-alpha-domain-containing protein n=1 Tax=Postia placenta MAD-698-R-SB12 TaxID=670580 RepID=A0A1X6N5V9_9APHY|nr:hypothetical protein POSPLADRAFT_1169191 [Postia placenta MAD-698-R-SB12]OSX63793.1 hypothetical protein POSPLADRAFT_1169191 [Postia placenta MAD-698-R-SB12]